MIRSFAYFLTVNACYLTITTDHGSTSTITNDKGKSDEVGQNEALNAKSKFIVTIICDIKIDLIMSEPHCVKVLFMILIHF